MSEYDFLEMDKPTEMKTEAEAIARLEAARERKQAEAAGLAQQREKEEAARKAREEEAAARLAQEETDRILALELQEKEEAKGRAQTNGQGPSSGKGSSTGAPVSVGQRTATHSKGESGERPSESEGGPSSLPVHPSSGLFPTSFRSSSKVLPPATLASAALTVNRNQPKVQAAINQIYGILNNYIQGGNHPPSALEVYESLRRFIENVSTTSPLVVENEQFQSDMKDLWNYNIIGGLSLLYTPSEVQSYSSARASYSAASASRQLTPEEVQELCTYLEDIRSVFVESQSAVSGRRLGGEKKKAIRKTKRKSTSVKSKPTRKYKKRSVSTKK